MEGLNISAWNQIKIIREIKNPDYLAPYTTSTTIMFDLFDDAQVDLTIKNLRNESILNILEKTLLFPGQYSTVPSIYSEDALAIYKCLIEIRDVKQHYLFFKDSTYMVLYQPDISSNMLGVTDFQGRYSTDDSLKFPSLLKNLPELLHTDVFSPEPRGRIVIQDSINITVWDPQNFLIQNYHEKIQVGNNHFELMWDPQPSMNTLKNSRSLNKEQTKHIIHYKNLQILQWKLYQNFPNPFN